MVKKIAWWHRTRPFLKDEPDEPEIDYCPFRNGGCTDRCRFFLPPFDEADEPCLIVESLLTRLDDEART